MLALWAGTASAESYSYVETFDDASTFTQSEDLPDGWVSTSNADAFKRYQGSYLGSGAHSGSYVLGLPNPTAMGRSAWLFSKMLTLKGGTKYTVTFWLKMPGGSAAPFNNNVIVKAGTSQTEAGATVTLGETGATTLADWTEQTYTFTPESDGDYTIAINATTQLYQASYVTIDDFEVTAEEETGGGETPTTPAEQETLFEETFDDADHFADGATVPTGWTVEGTYPFSRQTGSYFGLTAHSGSYVFGTQANSSSMSRDEHFCTPAVAMKAGQEYTLSYWYLAPGGASKYYATQVLTRVGTAQSFNDMKTTLGETVQDRIGDWTQVTYKYTPEADGNYYFGFGLLTQLYNAGSVLIDDVTVTGPKAGPDLPEPEDKTVCALPYSQSFDNENKDYDGLHYLPNGWLAVGSSPFVTASTDELEAKDGTYYAIAPESTIARDDRMYTPFFQLEAGKTYKLSYWLYMPGDGDNASDLTVTVGTEQDSEFHEGLDTLTAYTNTQWTEHTVRFTPEESDYYCFSFALGGEAVNAGEVCIDLVTLVEEGKRAKPKAAFSFNGHFNLMNSNLAVFSNSRIQMVNQTTDGDSYLWEINGAQPETTTEESPVVTFPASGTYTVKLTATNEAGTSTATETVDVELLSGDQSQLPLGAYNPNEDKLWTRDNMPSYDTYTGADFVTGINHYYTHFGELFNLPEGRDYTLTSATLYLCYYNLGNRYYSQEMLKPLRVVAYGVRDGRPDTTQVYGSFTTTMVDAFGTIGLSKAEMRGLPFDEAITVKGPFLLAFEFAKDLRIDEPDQNLSRTVVGFGGFTHRSGQTTCYVRPTDLPATSTYTIDGGYCPLDSLDAAYKGFGVNVTLWMNVTKDGQPTSIAVQPDGSVAFAVRLAGSTLTVSGTRAGDPVVVYNAAGQSVAQAVGTEGSTTLTLDAQPGLYIVSAPAGTQKILKK